MTEQDSESVTHRSVPMSSLQAPIQLSRIVALALEEDLGRGDVTTDACIPDEVQGRCTFGARSALVFAGGPVLREVFRQVDATVEVAGLVPDGTRVARDSVIAEVSGRAASLLKAERVALNFVQRLSGTATLTRAFVDALTRGAGTRIADTRKTTPGLRALERLAVRAGGGHNHREDLGAAVLIKDNHIAAAGGIAQAIRRCRSFAPHTSRIECEVDSLAQLEEALAEGADIILLDNFDDSMVAKAIAVNIARGRRALLEASGGITLERVAVLSALGIDVISVGALTHSAAAADVGLDWVEC
jgi:nicotinate-nucleotide pyrophosphorylase (carboxylating)